MNLVKKIIAITLFLSLITCFVLYRADVLKWEKDGYSKRLVHSLDTQKDSIDKHSRLIVNYVFHLKIDTLKASIEKSVVKTFTIENFGAKIIPSSKSIILYNELPSFKTENKKIRKELQQLNIERVRFTTNKIFEGISNDADLKEVIRLVKDQTLKNNSSLEQHISDSNTVDFYWNKFNTYSIEINNINNESGLLVGRKDVDEFLSWYSKLEEVRAVIVKNRMEIMSSSKSVLVDFKEQEDLAAIPEVRKLFKKKLKKHLNIGF